MSSDKRALLIMLIIALLLLCFEFPCTAKNSLDLTYISPNEKCVLVDGEAILKISVSFLSSSPDSKELSSWHCLATTFPNARICEIEFVAMNGWIMKPETLLSDEKDGQLLISTLAAFWKNDQYLAFAVQKEKVLCYRYVLEGGESKIQVLVNQDFLVSLQAGDKPSKFNVASPGCERQPWKCVPFKNLHSYRLWIRPAQKPPLISLTSSAERLTQEPEEVPPIQN